MTQELKTIDKTNDLPDWVRELRNRSWEMELLLAGFVLFQLNQTDEKQGRVWVSSWRWGSS